MNEYVHGFMKKKKQKTIKQKLNHNKSKNNAKKRDVMCKLKNEFVWRVD